MMSTVRIWVAGLFLLFLGAVAYWADTDTMPATLQALYSFPNGDRVGHFVLYGLLASLLTWAFPDRRIGKRIPLGPVMAGFVAVAEEASQLFILTRTADWVDLGCGLLGILAAYLTFVAWRQPAGGNRSRFVSALLISGVIGLGLATHAKSIQPFLPGFVSVYGGDMLYALMVFLGFGFLWPKSATGRVAVCALIFCWLIEFSQIYHAPWIDGIRHTRAGGLVLGYGFLTSDLVCYAIGITCGAACELITDRSRLKTAPTKTD